MLPWILMALACSEDPAECEAGFESRADDGLCYATAGDDDDDDPVETVTQPEPDPPTLDDLFAALPPCTAAGGDGDLDLQAGCAGGLCVGMLYEDVVAELGEPQDCFTLAISFDGFEYAYVECEWSGVSTQFDDDDLDGVADPGAPSYAVRVADPYAGSTSEGHALGSELSCFFEHGDPDYATFAVSSGDWEVRSLSFPSFSVSDQYDARGYYLSDGVVDGITFYGTY